ncbi:MAG: hypothetical protein JWM89_1831 [Acidimicrobiales bacterium]|nr:hypothetical protein [Acidimicrobiales bacterium]
MSDEPESEQGYVEQAAPWPTEPPTAKELMRYAAARGQLVSSGSWRFVGRGTNAHYALILETLHLHDLYLTLSTLHDIDAVKADEIAARLWITAEAGDLTGESLWAFCEAEGLDPGRIYDERIAAIDALPTVDREVRDSLRGLVVGTMCHCDERTEDGRPAEDCDHWQFYIVDDPEAVGEGGHVGRGRTLDEPQMRYLAELAAAVR